MLARMPLPRKRLALFYTYAVLSWIYGYYVIYKLTWFMSDRMAQYDLRNLGRFLSLSALLAWVIMPFWTFFKGLQLKREDWKPRGRMRRLWLARRLWRWPALSSSALRRWNLTIDRSGAVELANPEQVRAEVPGFLTEVYVKEGDQVVPGQPLALLTNREVGQQAVTAAQHVAMAKGNMQRALGTDHPAEYKHV